MSRAAEIMMTHVENVKRQLERDRTELAEAKYVSIGNLIPNYTKMLMKLLTSYAFFNLATIYPRPSQLDLWKHPLLTLKDQYVLASVE